MMDDMIPAIGIEFHRVVQAYERWLEEVGAWIREYNRRKAEEGIL